MAPFVLLSVSSFRTIALGISICSDPAILTPVCRQQVGVGCIIAADRNRDSDAQMYIPAVIPAALIPPTVTPPAVILMGASNRGAVRLGGCRLDPGISGIDRPQSERARHRLGGFLRRRPMVF
jgi:hypothetical protein